MRSGPALLTATPRGELLTQGFGRLGLEAKENPALEVFDQGIRFHCAAAVDEGFLLGGRRADGAAGAWRMDRQGRLTLITELERAPLGLVVAPPCGLIPSLLLSSCGTVVLLPVPGTPRPAPLTSRPVSYTISTKIHRDNQTMVHTGEGRGCLSA